MPQKVIVIGAGFAGLSSASFLAQKGYDVTLLEKHSIAGGRARMFEQQGFSYDMGPSWYWMPDVFERYFACFGKKVSDFYELVRLNPSYSVVFEDETWRIPAYMHEFNSLLESVEKGSGRRLARFLAQAAYKYRVGIQDLVHKPSRSVLEFADTRLLAALFQMDVLQSMYVHLRRFFKHPKILKLMEFPILFLGALPQNTPALYSLMNYADISLGTWYPMGGMYEIVKAMQHIAEQQGVKFRFQEEVQKIIVENKKATKVITQNADFEADIVVVGADYHHAETHFLSPEHQTYSAQYWDSRTLAPSALIFYVGLNKKLKHKPTHHTLFFDTDFMQHAHEIYTQPTWPQNPLFYVSVPSVTDSSIAPAQHENVFILIPVAHNLDDNEATREHYFQMVMERYATITGEDMRPNIVYKRSYAHNDFKTDYNAFKGNAYGLANTLMQTAILKPALKSKKVQNLFYTGQLTVPGPGVPPSLISGEVVAKEVMKEYPL